MGWHHSLGESFMDEISQEPPAVDPDNIPETLCIGRFNLAVGPGPLATLTFTHVRNKTGPLVDSSQIDPESVVRARIVITLENLAALRDLLNSIIKDPATPAASAGGSSKLN
jgi:hypothetical protein